MAETFTADDVSNKGEAADELPVSVTHVADDITNTPAPDAPKDAGPFKAVADWVSTAAESKSIENKTVKAKPKKES
jgi:hypothetical protein